MSLKHKILRSLLPLCCSIGLAFSLFTGSSMAAGKEGHDPHAHHKMMMNQSGYKSSMHNYSIPSLQLIDKHNNKLSTQQMLDKQKPVMLNFIYTSCTTICPVLSATFSQVQRELGSEAKDINMISISIDPEQDRPEQLKVYAERYKAGSEWKFLTGSIEDIVSLQKSFDAYRGDKMNHIPLTFIRSTPRSPWVRLEGFASAAEVVAEYRRHASH